MENLKVEDAPHAWERSAQNAPPKHVEATRMINLGTEEDPKWIEIGAALSDEESRELQAILEEYKEVFAWLYENMPSLNPALVCHVLKVNPRSKP